MILLDRDMIDPAAHRVLEIDKDSCSRAPPTLLPIPKLRTNQHKSCTTHVLYINKTPRRRLTGTHTKHIHLGSKILDRPYCRMSGPSPVILGRTGKGERSHRAGCRCSALVEDSRFGGTSRDIEMVDRCEFWVVDGMTVRS
jgi:hypothetical protein